MSQGRSQLRAYIPPHTPHNKGLSAALQRGNSTYPYPSGESWCLRLTLYGYNHPFTMSKKAASIAGLTEERVADLKEAFAMFDINGDGEFGTFSIFHACLPACSNESRLVAQQWQISIKSYRDLVGVRSE